MATGINIKKRGSWEVENYPTLPEWVYNLSWEDLIPEGLGSKYQRSTLYKSAKALYLNIYAPGNPRGVEYSPKAREVGFAKVRAIVRWMVKESIWKFSDLTPFDIIEFFRSKKSNRGYSLISVGTVRKWKWWFSMMWELRDYYSHPLSFDFISMEAELDAQLRSRPLKKWRALEEDVTLALTKDALYWMDNYGPLLTEIVEAAWVRGGRSIGRPRGARTQTARDFYAELEEMPQYQRLAEALSYVGPCHKVISIGLSVLEGACAFLLLVLVGMRASELLALNAGCIVERKSEDGFKQTYVFGVAAKKQGKNRLWVAADPVPRVVKVLENLTNCVRSGRKPCRALFISRSLGSPLFTFGRKPLRWNPTTLRKRVAAFVGGQYRKNSMPVNHFHPHMARKTLAQLAVLRDKSMLEPIAAQLGHVYSSFTDGVYVGSDNELAAMLVEADRKELARGLEELLTCKGVVGKAAPALEAMRRRVAKFPGKKSLNRLIDDLIRQGVQLAPCDWGYCVYTRVYSACDGDERGPKEAGRSPDVCAGCQNFAVTPTHRPFWEDRARREEEFLELPNLPEQTQAVVEARLKKTRTVLSKVIQLLPVETVDG